MRVESKPSIFVALVFLAVQEDLVASHRSPLGQSPLNVMQKDLGNRYRKARWRCVVRCFQRVVQVGEGASPYS